MEKYKAGQGHWGNGNAEGCKSLCKEGGKEGSTKMETLNKDPKMVRAFPSWFFP